MLYWSWGLLAGDNSMPQRMLREHRDIPDACRALHSVIGGRSEPLPLRCVVIMSYQDSIPYPNWELFCGSTGCGTDADPCGARRSVLPAEPTDYAALAGLGFAVAK